MTPEIIKGLQESKARDTEAAAVLDRAAVLVEQGWTTDADARDASRGKVDGCDESATCWCMRGAIIRAALDTGLRERHSIGRAFETAAKAIIGVETALGYSASHSAVTYYNDEIARDAADVAGKLREGARSLRENIRVVDEGIEAAARRQRVRAKPDPRIAKHRSLY